ncbi:hypothetical protein [Streptomyces goshikiensis]|uniref:hypothetical protein n=1 Tax=Streptomyces goshikiensis TaxID=1942 RepID=UPI003716ED2B
MDAAEVKQLLGAERVRGRSLGGLGCRAFDPGGKASVTVTVERGSAPGSVVQHARQILAKDPESLLVPVGGGWPALVGVGGGGETYATALLPCGNESAGDDLVVGMTAVRAKGGGTLEERREGLAALVTRALKQAAAAKGCEPAHADKPRMPSGAFTDLKKAGAATGTCRDTGLPSYETESDASAPIEQCLLAGAGGEPTFRLAAYYGPYPNAPRHDPSRSPDDYTGPSGTNAGKFWTTAACPTGEAPRGGPVHDGSPHPRSGTLRRGPQGVPHLRGRVGEATRMRTPRVLKPKEPLRVEGVMPAGESR